MIQSSLLIFSLSLIKMIENKFKSDQYKSFDRPPQKYFQKTKFQCKQIGHEVQQNYLHCQYFFYPPCKGNVPIKNQWSLNLNQNRWYNSSNHRQQLRTIAQTDYFNNYKPMQIPCLYAYQPLPCVSQQPISTSIFQQPNPYHIMDISTIYLSNNYPYSYFPSSLNTLYMQSYGSESFSFPIQKVSQQNTQTLDSKNTQNQKTCSNFKYSKKNAQSNVINQIFSFLSIKAKSYGFLSKIYNNQQQITFYYELMKQIKKKNKKYINRCYIKNLIEINPDHIIHSLIKKIQLPCPITLESLRKTLRILVIHYLQNICVPTILTSCKLDKQTKSEHMSRRKQVMSYIKYHIRFNQN